MSSRNVSTAPLWGICALIAAAAQGSVTDDEAARAALSAVTRLAGEARGAVLERQGARGPTFSVDSRWRVSVVTSTGDLPRLRDRTFRTSEHAGHTLDAPPSSAQIEAAARELLDKVFPDFDMAEMVLVSAKPRREQARVEALWRRTIPGSGFPGPGQCHVDFCWPDRAIYEIGAECPPIPDEWRRPATVTAQRAEEIGEKALGGLKGGWLETTKDYCVVDPGDEAKSRPAWNVMVRFGPRDNPEECTCDRSVFVDPWTGDIVHTTTWKGAGGGAPEAASRATTPRPMGAASSEGTASRPWLPWAGGGVALLVLVLGATTVCLRRRRS